MMMMKIQMMRTHTRTHRLCRFCSELTQRYNDSGFMRKISWINWFIIADEPYSYSMLRLKWFRNPYVTSAQLFDNSCYYAFIFANWNKQLEQLLSLHELLLPKCTFTVSPISNEWLHFTWMLLHHRLVKEPVLSFFLFVFRCFFFITLLSIIFHHIKYCCKEKQPLVRVRYSKVISLIFQ